MSLIKKQYEKFKNKHSHNIILKHSIESPNLKCDCVDSNTGEADEDCHKCFGTGLVYRNEKIKVRRSRSGSYKTDSVEFEDEPKSYGIMFDYFFDVDVDIKPKDIIIDRKIGEEKFELYIVTNWGQENGDSGIPAFKVAVTKKLHKPQQVIKHALYNIKKEQNIKTKIDKYINKKAIDIINKYPEKAKESKYIERIIYDILRYEDINNIDSNFINLIEVKYDFDNASQISSIIKNIASEYLAS